MHPRVRLDASGVSSISSSCRKFNLVSSVAQPFPNHYTDCAIRDGIPVVIISRTRKDFFFSGIKTEQVTSPEANCLSAIQSIFPFICHHRSYNTDCTSHSLNHRCTRILSQNNKFQILTPYFLKIRLSIFPHLHPRLPSYLFPSVLTTRIIYASSNRILMKGRRQRDN